jgi:hypothetical protein
VWRCKYVDLELNLDGTEAPLTFVLGLFDAELSGCRGEDSGRIVDPLDVGRCDPGVVGRDLFCDPAEPIDIFLACTDENFFALEVETLRPCPRRAAAAAGEDGLPCSS